MNYEYEPLHGSSVCGVQGWSDGRYPSCYQEFFTNHKLTISQAKSSEVTFEQGWMLNLCILKHSGDDAYPEH